MYHSSLRCSSSDGGKLRCRTSLRHSETGGIAVEIHLTLCKCEQFSPCENHGRRLRQCYLQLASHTFSFLQSNISRLTVWTFTVLYVRQGSHTHSHNRSLPVYTNQNFSASFYSFLSHILSVFTARLYSFAINNNWEAIFDPSPARAPPHESTGPDSGPNMGSPTSNTSNTPHLTATSTVSLVSGHAYKAGSL